MNRKLARKALVTKVADQVRNTPRLATSEFTGKTAR